MNFLEEEKTHKWGFKDTDFEVNSENENISFFQKSTNSKLSK